MRRLLGWLLPLVTGVAVIVLLMPWYGVDPLPPQCWSMFDYRVPCGNGLALSAGGAIAGLVAVALWWRDRRNSGPR